MKSRLVKTIAAVALALTLIVMCMPMALAAQTSGKCGDNATWSYNAQTCELKIEGTGAVEWADEWSQFDEASETPATAKLKTLVIADGITDISALRWQGYYSLEKVTVPATVTAKIAEAFINQTDVSEVVFNGTKAQWNSIAPDYLLGYEGTEDPIHELKISCTDGKIVVIENTTVSPSATNVDNEADTEKKDTNTDSANSNSSVNNNNSADNEDSGNSSTIIIVAIAAAVIVLIIAIVAVVLVKKK